MRKILTPKRVLMSSVNRFVQSVRAPGTKYAGSLSVLGSAEKG